MWTTFVKHFCEQILLQIFVNIFCEQFLWTTYLHNFYQQLYQQFVLTNFVQNFCHNLKLTTFYPKYLSKLFLMTFVNNFTRFYTTLVKNFFWHICYKVLSTYFVDNSFCHHLLQWLLLTTFIYTAIVATFFSKFYENILSFNNSYSQLLNTKVSTKVVAEHCWLKM